MLVGRCVSARGRGRDRVSRPSCWGRGRRGRPTGSELGPAYRRPMCSCDSLFCPPVDRWPLRFVCRRPRTKSYGGGGQLEQRAVDPRRARTGSMGRRDGRRRARRAHDEIKWPLGALGSGGARRRSSSMNLPISRPAATCCKPPSACSSRRHLNRQHPAAGKTTARASCRSVGPSRPLVAVSDANNRSPARDSGTSAPVSGRWLGEGNKWPAGRAQSAALAKY